MQYEIGENIKNRTKHLWFYSHNRSANSIIFLKTATFWSRELSFCLPIGSSTDWFYCIFRKRKLVLKIRDKTNKKEKIAFAGLPGYSMSWLTSATAIKKKKKIFFFASPTWAKIEEKRREEKRVGSVCRSRSVDTGIIKIGYTTIKHGHNKVPSIPYPSPHGV